MRLPQVGEVISYSLSDAIGRIRVDDGSAMHFGSSALLAMVPSLGLRVTVTRVAPLASGGFKATVIASVEHEDPEYRAKVAAFERAAAEEIEAMRPHLELRSAGSGRRRFA